MIAAQAGAQLFGGGNRLRHVRAGPRDRGDQRRGRDLRPPDDQGPRDLRRRRLRRRSPSALFLFLAPQFHWGQGHRRQARDYPGAFVLGFMTCFALVASWYPFASDYSRYLPASSSTRSVPLWPVVGVTLPMLLLGLFGLLLPTIDARPRRRRRACSR